MGNAQKVYWNNAMKIDHLNHHTLFHSGIKYGGS